MDQSFSSKVIESTFKGFPIDSYGKTLEQFLATKPNLFNSNFQFPIMVLKESALNNNIAQMMSFCDSVKAELAPHVKTTMSPQLAKMQIAAGASALTVANFWQASIFLKFGFKKMIIANEVLDPMAIAAIAKINKLKQAEIIFYVDSLEFLERGGRITAMQAKMGASMNLKPLLHMINGKVEQQELVRSSEKSIARMIEIVGAAARIKSEIAIHHVEALDAANSVAQQLKELTGLAAISVTSAGAVVGTHVGPGALAVVVSPQV